MFRFRLLLRDGTDAGELTSAVSSWRAGDVIHTGATAPNWRVVQVVAFDEEEADDDGQFIAFLVVEPARVLRR